VIVGRKVREGVRGRKKDKERGPAWLVETRVLTVEEWDPDNSFLFPLL
jgi:hypothetical protein